MTTLLKLTCGFSAGYLFCRAIVALLPTAMIVGDLVVVMIGLAVIAAAGVYVWQLSQ